MNRLLGLSRIRFSMRSVAAVRTVFSLSGFMTTVSLLTGVIPVPGMLVVRTAVMRLGSVAVLPGLILEFFFGLTLRLIAMLVDPVFDLPACFLSDLPAGLPNSPLGDLYAVRRYVRVVGFGLFSG